MSIILFLTVVVLGVAMAFKYLGLDVTIQLPSSKAKTMAEPVPVDIKVEKEYHLPEIKKEEKIIEDVRLNKDQLNFFEKELMEKSKEVQQLSMQLQAQQQHLRQAQQVKMLLDEEIIRLREQNRQLRINKENVNV